MEYILYYMINLKTTLSLWNSLVEWLSLKDVALKCDQEVEMNNLKKQSKILYLCMTLLLIKITTE